MYQLIRASAGTGKTFRLSGQYLRQLFLGHQPDSILATTFTRKAAGEIQGRVLTRLAAAAESAQQAELLAGFLELPQITTELSEQLLSRLTRDLHRMRICTLDSFFQQIARGLTLELGLPPGWSIVDEHLDRELREQAIDAVLSQQLPRDAQQLMQMLAHGRSRRSVRDLIDNTVSNYHELFLQTDEPAWNLVPTPVRLTMEQREQALHQLAAAELPADKRFSKGRQEDIERFRTEKWDLFIAKGLAARVLDGSEKYYGKEISDELCGIYQRLLAHARAELLHRLSRQMQAIYNLISRFDREYAALKADHGWLGFADVTRILSGSGSSIDGDQMNYRLDSSIRNLLLDEFQDTSSNQWSILRRLTDVLLQSDQETSFLCVGDGKQAIYGWRGGVAEILDAVPPAIPGIEELPLNESRRSSPAVIHTVNRIFSGLTQHSALDHLEDACRVWQQRFPEHSTARQDMPGCAVLRTSPELDDDAEAEERKSWNRWVAEQIRLLHEQTPGAEIGVLTRKNSTVARLVHELNQLGVPASEEGGTPPTDSAAVLAVLSLLHLSAHPACTVSRFHVACSPLGPIVGLSSWQDDQQASAVAESMRARLVDDGYGTTLQWLSDSCAPHCSNRDRLRLSQITAEGLAFDEAGSLNPADFVRLLENSRFQKSERSPVRVMTVHQSKGLEFDRVVLPELEAPLFRTPQAAFTGPDAGSRADRVCVWTSRALWPMLPDSLQQAFADTEHRNVAESLCLLYVAVTRAKHDLTMLIQPTNPARPPKTFAGLLVAALADAPADQPLSTLFSTGSEHWYEELPEMLEHRLPRKRSSPATAPLTWLELSDGRRRGLARRSPSDHAVTSFAQLTTTRSGSRPPQNEFRHIDARLRGTLIHHWFEQITWLDEGELPSEQSLLNSARSLLPSDSVRSALLQEFLNLLLHPGIRSLLLRETAAQNLPAAVQNDNYSNGDIQCEVENERTFLFRDQRHVVHGSVDRLILYRHQGQIIAADIVDWKTDRRTGPEEEWIVSRRSHYHEQLQAYRRAVMHIHQLPAECVRARLVLLDTGTVCITSE